MPPYAELHCLSNFSFLRGASHPAELVERAAELGYRALALTDECSVAGVVRAWEAARECGLKLIIGSEFRLEDGLRLVLLAADREGYGRLCRLITRGRRAAPKGDYRLSRDDLVDGQAGGPPGCLALWLPGQAPDEDEGRWVAAQFPGRAWLAVELFAGGDDAARLAALEALGERLGLPRVAAGDVHMHDPARRPLQDLVTAIRLNTPLHALGRRLFPNGERHLRPRNRLARLYPAALLEESVAIAARCGFTLDELDWRYPAELVPAGQTPASWLRRLTRDGMARRWPGGAPETVRQTVDRELALIEELGYEAYFLTVHDIVRHARSLGILCQGRGSAANSAVCFCLGITEVDPARMSVLFERFISKERNEPPDIDVDFEHERREEVIQYIYAKYGRHRAALAATVIRYRPRSALRDAGKALGLAPLQYDALARAMRWWDGREIAPERVRDAGFDPDNPVIARVLALARQLVGSPRHLSQHVGGFVIADGCLEDLVPVENAAMSERTVIQWDKDDLDAVGMIKVDVLGLGMLSAIRRSFALVEKFCGRGWTLATVPAEDPAVYEMISDADTMGVFQVESRAQMAMLPRLRPRCFYDLVIEIALIRPGPIQGDMVHPYLRRRNGEEAVSYPSEEVRQVLERTLGVPIFQEQVMQLAIVAAGFSAGEADQLRRAMAAWRRKGGLGPFEERLIEGMRARGYTADFAQRIFRQITGFGEYGFPESHSASFALLVYVSAWLKRHEPAAFLCALINSQPMGFYAPSQLVQDARRHGVEVRPVDVAASDWDCTLEPGEAGHEEQPAARLGMRLVAELSAAGAARLVAARREQPFQDVDDLARRARLDRGDLGALARAGALRGLSGHRHRAAWAVAGIEAPLPLLEEASIREGLPLLRAPTEGRDIVADYRSTGLTLGRHPLALLRERLAEDGLVSTGELNAAPHGAYAACAGVVINRQRPGSAKGVMFVTLEDETGQANIVVWQQVSEAWRKPLLGARLLEVAGRVQREGQVVHLVAERMRDRSALLGQLDVRSRDFH
ncbi:error-prone DNA polymerase [Thioalkalivibrio sp. XN279]|uniref:error-prone DNA polymerase n=1 Tax=Thioalkalivibrio sp. XN279 TaxID=2714953 RepID=UPI0014091655|nr:error-prone DNA polymerase [Thioalkalivibrio sp. XN279]NHA14310.1 error-prone DNA polymerase [Thioalkalivibrio sp. XN279]